MLIHEEMFLCEACSDMSEFHVTKKINKHTFTDYDRDLFYKHLTGYDFAAAGTSRRKRERDNSAVPVHFRNIKHIKKPLLKLRYPVRTGCSHCYHVPGSCFSGETIHDRKIQFSYELPRHISDTSEQAGTS